MSAHSRTTTREAARHDDPSRLAGRAGFVGGLTFALLASAAVPMLALLFREVLPVSAAAGVSLVATTLAFTIYCAPTPRMALKALIILVPGFSALALAGLVSGSIGPGVVILCCAAALAWVRSGVFYTMSGRRSLATELCLQGAGLGLAALLAGPGLLGMAAATWGYLLVQSLFGLVPGKRRRAGRDVAGDAFSQACRRLERLLEA